MAKKMDKPGKATNGPDPVRVKQVVDKIENLNRDLESERGSYMAKCRTIREDISSVYDEAKAYGIDKKALRATMKRRELEAKIDKLDADFEEDQRTAYEQLGVALGDFQDTPLGGAAMSKAKPADDDFDRVGEENAMRVAAGISPLN